MSQVRKRLFLSFEAPTHSGILLLRQKFGENERIKRQEKGEKEE